MPDRVARTLTVLLGIWLYVSAFLWSHTAADRVSDWTVGLGFVAFAVIAATIPVVRWANAVLAAWLFVSAFALPHVHAAARWNEAIVGVLVFLLSVVSRTGEGTRRVPGAEQHAAA